jgi:hypothetical protein
MDQEVARALANLWVRAHDGGERQEAAQTCNWLSAALMGLLPETEDFAVAEYESQLAVAGFADGSVIVVIPTGTRGLPDGEQAATATVYRHPLDASTAQIKLEETVRVRAIGGLIRDRRWEFLLASGVPAVVFNTTERVPAAPGQEHPHDEGVARALARALCWLVPDPDRSLLAYG